MPTESLEQAFFREFSDLIADRKSRSVQFLADGGFVNEAEARDRVGYIRACNDLREDFSHLLKAYFPST